VNKGQQEDRKLAMAGQKKKKVSTKGSWLPKSVFMTQWARETRTRSSRVTDSTFLAGPTLGKVSVLTQDSLSLYYSPAFKRCTFGNLECLNMIMFHALRIPSVHWGTMVGENRRLVYYQLMDFPSWPVQISNHRMAIRL
jgi:hypothetical protein